MTEIAGQQNNTDTTRGFSSCQLIVMTEFTAFYGVFGLVEERPSESDNTMMDDVVRSKSPLSSAGPSSAATQGVLSPLCSLQSTYQSVSFGHILELLEGKKNRTKQRANQPFVNRSQQWYMAFSSNKYPSNRTGAPPSSSGAPSMFAHGAAGTNQHRGYYQDENKEVEFDPGGVAGGAGADGGGVGRIRRGGGGEAYRYNNTHSSSTSFGEPASYRFQHGGGTSSRRHAMDEQPQHYDYNNHQAPYSAPHGYRHSHHQGRRYEPSPDNEYYQHQQYDQQHQRHLQQHHQQDHMRRQQESAGHYNHNYRQAKQRYDYFSSHNKAPPPPQQQSLGPPPQSSQYYQTTLPDIPTLVESDASDLEDSDDPKYMGSWGGQRSATRGGPKPPPSTAVTYAKKPPPTPPSPPPPRRPSSFYDTGGEEPNLLEKVATLKYVEVAPGVHVRLRGADETWRSIESDFYMPTQCLPCGLTVFCIQDADFVICPDCRVVSPMMMVMEGGEECSNYCEGKSDGGVGLGFTMEDLAAWQEDIERQRRIISR